MTVTTRPNPTRTVPVSPAAWSALHAEIERGHAGPTHRPDRDLARRHDVIADLLREVTVVEDATTAAIGRRVTFREADGTRTTVALVIPGDGDPKHGWISIDAPLGLALLGARTGDTVLVRAPAGDRTVHIEAVA